MTGATNGARTHRQFDRKTNQAFLAAMSLVFEIPMCDFVIDPVHLNLRISGSFITQLIKGIYTRDSVSKHAKNVD